MFIGILLGDLQSLVRPTAIRLGPFGLGSASLAIGSLED
jgi:hypothetical protein